MMIKLDNMKKLKKLNKLIMISLLTSACMLTTSMVNGSVAYGAEAPAGTADFDYNGYSAAQLKAISECIAGIQGKPCPSYSASTVDHYTGTVNHANMPTGVISTRSGWLQWADAAMKANSYDGVYGLVKLSSANDTTHTVKEGSCVFRFRLVGINQDDRSDGTGKAGLTFQFVTYLNMPSSKYGGSWKDRDRMNNGWTAYGGWRDSELRKSMNNGIIWNVFPSAFRDNVTSVNKATNNQVKYHKYNDSGATSVTADKLWILSPSEMGMSVSNKGHIIWSDGPAGADVHVYNGDGRYDNTVKATDDGTLYREYTDGLYRRLYHLSIWYTNEDYLYSDDVYQWWMLPAGDRKMSDGNHAYHNTDSYSYCAVAIGTNPSSKNSNRDAAFWLRSPRDSGWFAHFDCYAGDINNGAQYNGNGVVTAFSF